MRSLPPDFDAETVAAIDERLRGVEGEQKVSIPLAIESGSRAWGFPSPDSDYDCRFVFVRHLDGYLSPWPLRDVIETPLEGDLDVNGWDLRKALSLLLKGNAVIIEWLTSPIAYCGDPTFRSAFLDLAQSIADRGMIGRHDLRMGEKQRDLFFSDPASVAQKKIFYVLRPALALRWLRLNPNAVVAPMHFPTALAQAGLEPDVRASIELLLASKAQSRELGRARLPPAIDAFINAELALAGPEFAEVASSERRQEARDRATAFFVQTVKRLDGASFAR